MPASFENVVLDLGLTLDGVAPLSRRAVWKAQAGWRAVYARACHRQTGAWTFRGYDWHVFSYGHCPHRSGAAAVLQLEAELPCRVVVFSDAGDTQEEGLEGRLVGIAPRPSRRDLIIAPLDMRRTLVLTHETDLGPYVSRADWAHDGEV